MIEIYENNAIAKPAFKDCLVDGKFSNSKSNELEIDYIKKSKSYLNSLGYTKNETGKIFKTPMADSYAYYMVISLDRKNGKLMHLNIGDEWDDPMVRHLESTFIRENMFNFEEMYSELT